MLTTAHLADELERIAHHAANLAESVRHSDDYLRPLALAEELIETTKLNARLNKLADRIAGPLATGNGDGAAAQKG